MWTVFSKCWPLHRCEEVFERYELGIGVLFLYWTTKWLVGLFSIVIVMLFQNCQIGISVFIQIHIPFKIVLLNSVFSPEIWFLFCTSFSNLNYLLYSSSTLLMKEKKATLTLNNCDHPNNTFHKLYAYFI